MHDRDGTGARGGEEFAERRGVDVAAEPEPGLAPAADPAEGTQIGKRYTLSGDAALELLVTKPGKYGLSIDGTPLVLKEAKPLPASD